MIPREAMWKAVLHSPMRNFFIGWVLMAVVLFFIGYAIMTYPTEVPYKALFGDSP